MKIAWHNSNYKEADIIIIGVKDESGSRSKRRGCSKGPDAIRKSSNLYEKYSRTRVAQSETGIIKKKIHDLGNIKKKDITKTIQKIIKDKKIPVTFGGDHSITKEIIKGINKKIALIYFDSHPDFRCEDKDYFGSVICDIKDKINLKKTIEIGVRDMESEEIKNALKYKIKLINPMSIVEHGPKKIVTAIKKIINKTPVYISIDIDVVDPGNAPGVSTPVPGGLTPEELIYLTKKLSRLNIIGFDIMEVNPKYDINDMTSHLAAKTMIEIISSFK